MDHEVRPHARFDRPADDSRIKPIEHDRQIQHASLRPNLRDSRTEEPVRHAWRELALQQIWRDRQLMLRVRHYPIALLMPNPGEVLAHEPLNARLARLKTERTKFLGHAGRSVSGLHDFHMNSPHRYELAGSTVAETNRKNLAQRREWTRPALRINSDVRRIRSFAKYATVFFAILSWFWVRRRASYSGFCVTTFAPALRNLTAARAMNQLRSVCSRTYQVSGGSAQPFPVIHLLHTRSLELGVCAYFSILNIKSSFVGG